MKSVRVLAVLLLLLAPVALAGELIVKSLPLPTDSPGDLAWDGQALWIADWQAGQLIRFDPERGRVLERIDAPCYRPRGLAWGDGLLYVLDDFEGRVYALDPATGIVSSRYRAPNGTGLGLAWDGEALWLADNGENTLQRLIPGDGTALTYFRAPHREPSGLAFDGRYLWVAQRNQDRVYLVDPETGLALGSFDTPGPYPCGLAPAPGGRLWLADFETGMLHLCDPRGADPVQVDDWRDVEIRMTYRMENFGPGEVRDLSVCFALPEPELENQVITGGPDYGAMTPRFEQDCWGQKLAVFTRDRLKAGDRFEAGYSLSARLADLNMLIIPEKVGALEEIPAEIREAYTIDGERLQVASELIATTAAKIVGEERHPFWIARKVYDGVIEALEYERVGGWDVPETLIKRGTGSCSEYAFLYIALCRAAGLPARYEAGASLRGDDASVDQVHHRWAEVYLPGYGWVPVDPSGGDSENPGTRADRFGRLSNRLFVTTHGGGGSEYLSWTYNYEVGYSQLGRCELGEDEWVEWRRAKEEGQAVRPRGQMD